MKTSHIIATVAVAIFATAASAQPVAVKVGYADLNLNSAAGQAVLGQRIDAAARKACGVDANERLLPMSMAAAQCHQDAVAKTSIAVASAYAPVLASR
jgi:UrcA family protein